MKVEVNEVGMTQIGTNPKFPVRVNPQFVGFHNFV